MYLSNQVLSDAILMRRHLHAWPELSGEESRTADFVCGMLSQLGIEFERNIGGHGIVAAIRRGRSGRSVGLRCELDALPIDEANDFEHKSRRSGVMHACGHDGHMAALLGAARLLLANDGWEGVVRLIFQPAEETGLGARAMIEDGFLERFWCDRIFAFHNMPDLESGIVAVHDSAVMAAGNELTITITGTCAHAAWPHLSRDPVIVAGHLIVATQTIVSRMLPPSSSATISLTTVNGGVAANQIPDCVVIGGTVRTFSEIDRRRCLDAVRRHCEGLAVMFDVDITLSDRVTSDPIVNTAGERDIARRAASGNGLQMVADLAPTMIGDDFARFLSHMPGAYVWIGNGPSDGGRALHQRRYDFDDRSLATAIPWLAQTALFSLQEAGDTGVVCGTGGSYAEPSTRLP